MTGRRGLIVLGMHRSGTSALARCLSLLGAGLPRTLMPPGPDNPRGFWESQKVAAINDAILAAGGSCWHDWRRFESGRLTQTDLARFEAKIEEALDAEFGEAALFVLKDPRLCRLLPIWLPVLARLCIAVHVILPIRHPGAVVRSLARRNGFPPSLGALLWLRHVLDAERDCRSLPRAFISHENLLADWRPAVRLAADRLGLTWPVDPDVVVDPELERRAPETAAPDTGSTYAEIWCRHAWNALRALEHGDRSALRILDQVRGQFDDAARLFAAPPLARPSVAGRPVMREVTLCAADSLLVPLTERAVARSAAACDFGAVRLLTEQDLATTDDYSAFVLKRLVEHVPSSHALIVQWDGFVVSPEAWDPDFLAFDYIGARWWWHTHGSDVGNGGFSLRSRRLLDALADARFTPQAGVAEDELICRVWRPLLERDYLIRFAPAAVADRFSYERVQSSRTTFGFHGVFNLWRHLSADDLAETADILPASVIAGTFWAELVARCVTERRDSAPPLLRAWSRHATPAAIRASLRDLLPPSELAWATEETR